MTSNKNELLIAACYGNMYTLNFFRRCAYTFAISGLITLIIGALSIPDQMPTISQQNEETQQQASDRVTREHNQIIIRSKGFLLTMIGTGLICLSIICLFIIMKYFDHIDYETKLQVEIIKSEVKIVPEPLKSALKVTKTRVLEPHIEVKPEPILQQYRTSRPHITIIKAPPHKNEAVDHMV